MTVRVYSGNVLVDEQTFPNEALAVAFASEMQDQGFKVRLVEVA